jgi:dipeptidyl aminopeptidase/acylaminoacyl peptidase/uncharacterized protein (DUF885 family)
VPGCGAAQCAIELAVEDHPTARSLIMTRSKRRLLHFSICSFLILLSGEVARRARAQEPAGERLDRTAGAGAPAAGTAESGAAMDGADSDELFAPRGDPWYAPQAQARLGRPDSGQALIFKARINPHWTERGARFWYRNDLGGGAKEFILVDAEKGVRRKAFDHEKLAAALSQAAGGSPFRADHLPFDEIELPDDGKAVRFVVGATAWICRLDRYHCTRAPASSAPGSSAPRAGAGTAPQDQERPGCRRGPARATSGPGGGRSPDGNWTAVLKDHNVFLRREGDTALIRLSDDGKGGLAYGQISWAPDSRTLVAFRIEPGDRKEVYLIQSSPPGGGRARLRARPYELPGDKFTAYEINLFDVASRKQTKPKVERVDYGTPRLRWDKDGGHFLYEKIDRGHQRYRLVEIDAHTGAARNIIDETSNTFIWTAHREALNLDTVYYLASTPEILFVSERDGWRRLYLVDRKRGTIKNPLMQGEYVLCGVEDVDEAMRQVTFRACGKNAGEDPYFEHFYRVNFDGTGLVALTAGNGTHAAQFSPDRRFLIDSYSRVARAPVHALRRTSDGKLVCKLEEADASALMQNGWRPPEVFVAKGRDGKTDIWGLIYTPKDLDPHKKYPVIEQIYAGPQGSYVLKHFSTQRRFAPLVDLGFIVVQIDGMGTANRSKAFHDVCWHNLKDAGFPDRLLWHQAASRKYPWYDIARVGIYGTSAGGQNATAGVLFYPDFYKAAVSACGCHDNRMDKASWNEQWMGYPVGPWYAESSNIENAHRLRGKLLLIVSELDTNVPPESTMRLVDALVKAGKDFELLVIPGANHGPGGAYGIRRMHDFFVRHLLRKEPPDQHAGMARDAYAAGIRSNSRVGPRAGARNPSQSAAALDLEELNDEHSEILGAIRRYSVDVGSLQSFLPPPASRKRDERLRQFTLQWLDQLGKVSFDALSRDGQVDYLLFKNHLEHQLRQLDRRARELEESSALVPFAEKILELDESRREQKRMDWSQIASALDRLGKEIGEKRRALEKEPRPQGSVKKATANRALATVEGLRGTLRGWFGFYDGYDPLFSWWVQEPYKSVDQAIDAYAGFLRQRYRAVTTGTGDQSGPGAFRRAGRGGPAPGTEGSRALAAPPERAREIVGNPIGRAALESELKHEMISYSPEELLELANAEMRWCEREMKKAAREMGYRDDWRAALEHVKTLHVEPGKQPALIRELALEAIKYIDDHELVSLPALCRESWRMEMMSPERQLMSPFFLGGEVISVSFPTASMPHEAKLMSMRGNNIHFARATVFHEVIPGHHLQQFMTSRYKTYRRVFSTPFWTEGWALYWELLLWDKGFARSPEDRVGMLFWRMHRCARIIFSLGFHLEKMSPQQCIDLLVEKVGHERDNATAEVRRSFTSFYGPLYQAAYLLGGLQLRALHREIVESGQLTEREFHDTILKQNGMPIEMVRALMSGRRLSPDYVPNWRFNAENTHAVPPRN